MIHLGDLPNWQGAHAVAVDIETRDDQLRKLGPGVRRGGYITGVSFAVDRHGNGNGDAYYLPVRHEGGGNYDPDQVFAYLADQADRFRGDIVGANLQYDLDYLMESGVCFHRSQFRDVQVAGALLMVPQIDRATGAEKIVPMNLNAIAQRLGLPGKDEAKLDAWAKERGLDPKSDMWRAPASVVADYAKQDVLLPLQVIRMQHREIDAQDLWTVYNLESDLLPVLVDMRRRGVRVDLDRIEQVEIEARKHEDAAFKQVAQISGMPFGADDLNSADRIAKHLAVEGITCPTTKTGKPSVKAAWLQSLTTPIAAAIQDARKWNKVRTTFCASIRSHAIEHGPGNVRVHCTFNQLRQEREDGTTKGVGFGRLSATDPNLQNQPARDPVIGPLWRSIYLPDDGGTWACLDFSSQEPRWITHYAEKVANDTHMFPHPWSESTREAARYAAQSCRTDPQWDNHSMMAGMIFPGEYTQQAYIDGDKHAKHLRSVAKQIFLGLCLAQGTRLLTNVGPVPIEDVTTDHLLWDGITLVEHGGVTHTGLKDCIELNGTWMTPGHEVLTSRGWFQAQDLCIGSQNWGWYSASLRSKLSPMDHVVAFSPSSAVARVVDRLLLAETTWCPVNRHAVLNVVKRLLLRHVHDTAACLNPIVVDFLAALVRSLADVLRENMRVTVLGESESIKLGSTIEAHFWIIWSRFRDGIIHHLTSTDATTTVTTNLETFDLSPTLRTCETLDVLDAGPRNRFMLEDGRIVSNCYGMGGGKLCQELGLPAEYVEVDWSDRPVLMAGDEGKQLLARFDAGVPYVRALAKLTRQVAEKRGVLRTILGRQCRFPAAIGGGYDWAYKGLNRLIQGTSADQTKMAMVNAAREGYKIQLQVHDEVDLTIYDPAEATRLAQIMVDAVPANVPTRVDIETGPDWGSIK